MSKLDQWGEKIQETEPWFDRMLTKLAAHSHTAKIVCVVTALALATGLLMWLIFRFVVLSRLCGA